MDIPEDAVSALRGLVGGHFESLPLPGGRYMVLNTEAKVDPHCINHMATELAHNAESILPDDYIAGTVVIAPTLMMEQGYQ